MTLKVSIRATLLVAALVPMWEPSSSRRSTPIVPWSSARRGRDECMLLDIEEPHTFCFPHAEAADLHLWRLCRLLSTRSEEWQLASTLRGIDRHLPSTPCHMTGSNSSYGSCTFQSSVAKVRLEYFASRRGSPPRLQDSDAADAAGSPGRYTNTGHGPSWPPFMWTSSRFVSMHFVRTTAT